MKSFLFLVSFQPIFEPSPKISVPPAVSKYGNEYQNKCTEDSESYPHWASGRGWVENGPQAYGVTVVPRFTELDGEADPARKDNIALSGKAGGHLGNEVDGHKDPGLGEVGAV